MLIGIVALALMLWEPHLEGRNVNATVFEIYFRDPFLAYVYFASISFFVGLFQAFRVLGYTRHGRIFSHEAVRALRIMKYCAVAMIGFVVVAEIFIIFAISDDDRAGGVVMGVLVIFGSIVIATLAAVSERLLQDAVDMKSENDLTV